MFLKINIITVNRVRKPKKAAEKPRKPQKVGDISCPCYSMLLVGIIL